LGPGLEFYWKGGLKNLEQELAAYDLLYSEEDDTSTDTMAETDGACWWMHGASHNFNGSHQIVIYSLITVVVIHKTHKFQLSRVLQLKKKVFRKARLRIAGVSRIVIDIDIFAEKSEARH
jgi:predicted RNase H-like nuclease